MDRQGVASAYKMKSIHFSGRADRISGLPAGWHTHG
jgi:hypothetical protein